MRTPLVPGVLSAWLLGVGGAHAMDPRPPVHPYDLHAGQRVRVWASADGVRLDDVDSVVTAVDAAGLTVVRDGRAETVRFEDMSRLRVRRGWRYMRTAAIAGAAAGIVLATASNERGAGHPDGWSRARAAFYGAAGGGALGALTAGAIWPVRWYPVTLDAVRPPPAPAVGWNVTLRLP